MIVLCLFVEVLLSMVVKRGFSSSRMRVCGGFCHFVVVLWYMQMPPRIL